MYWEDRVTEKQYSAIEKAIEVFQKGKRTRDAQHELYDHLTNNGMTSEEADEYINLLLENA